jgi:DNA polymerase-3 subunit delta'
MEWNILGHEWAAKLLATHIARHETRHAYLFTGPPGVGRRSLALRFAQALNCVNPPAPGLLCGACRPCLQIEKMQQSDLSVIQAVDDEGIPKEGGSLKIDQIRDLQRGLSLSPYESKLRIALLLRFEEANANAQNAFLKTLEEPPEKAILLVTASASENLLPTISSRCEVLRLRPLPVAELEEALQSRWNLEPGEARRLAHISGGRPGYALRLHHSPAELERRQEWLEDLQRLMGENRRQRFGYVDQEFKESKDNREKLRQALPVWLSYWRDVLLTACGSNAPLTNLDQAEGIGYLAQRMDAGVVRQRVSDLEQAVGKLDANANTRLLAEVILLDWPRISL